MKRSPMVRRTPLKAGSSALRRGALVRQSALSRTAMAKPSRPSVSQEEREARRLLTIRSQGRCEMCGREPATDAHHRVNRSQGGRWEVSNLLHLCHREHMHVTTNPALARSRGWSVAGHTNPAMAPVWLAGRGWSLLRPNGSVIPTESSAA